MLYCKTPCVVLHACDGAVVAAVRFVFCELCRGKAVGAYEKAPTMEGRE